MKCKAYTRKMTCIDQLLISDKLRVSIDPEFLLSIQA